MLEIKSIYVYYTYFDVNWSKINFTFLRFLKYVFFVPIADSYVRHPNSYLPTHGYNIPSEAEGDCLHSPGGDSDDVEPYGFPSNRNRRKPCEDDIGSVITTLGTFVIFV